MEAVLNDTVQHAKETSSSVRPVVVGMSIEVVKLQKPASTSPTTVADASVSSLCCVSRWGYTSITPSAASCSRTERRHTVDDLDHYQRSVDDMTYHLLHRSVLE